MLFVGLTGLVFVGLGRRKASVRTVCATDAGPLFRWESVCLVLWCITCTLPAGRSMGAFLSQRLGCVW